MGGTDIEIGRSQAARPPTLPGHACDDAGARINSNDRGVTAGLPSAAARHVAE